MATIVPKIGVEVNAALRPSNLQITDANVTRDEVNPERPAGPIRRIPITARDRFSVKVVVLGCEDGIRPGAVADYRGVGEQISAIFDLDDAVGLECNCAAEKPAGANQIRHTAGKGKIPGTSHCHVIEQKSPRCVSGTG